VSFRSLIITIIIVFCLENSKKFEDVNELKNKISKLKETLSELEKKRTEEREENAKLRQINQDLILEIGELKQKHQTLQQEKVTHIQSSSMISHSHSHIS
jgi:uncharacterized coiled-coil DUF342 family protein